MHRDSKLISETYTQVQRMQKTATTDFIKDEVIEGFAYVLNNVDKAGVLMFLKALKSFLPQEDFASILHKLADKVDHDKMRAAGEFAGAYKQETGNVV